MAIELIGEPYQKQFPSRKRKYIKALCTLCGKEFETRFSDCKKYNSCGCAGRYKKKHGMTGSTEYKIWSGMKRRCECSHDDKYELYGGRGIKVCERWQDFESFLKDMGNRPHGKTLDRIDSNGDYEPRNCRWASIKQQNNNKRTNKFLKIYGKTMTLSEWHNIVSHETNYTTVSERLNRGWSHKESVFGKAK